MTDSHPLVVMTDRLAQSPPSYVTTIVELEQILSRLSRQVPLSIIEIPTHPDDISVAIKIGFTLSRKDVENDRARAVDPKIADASERAVRVLSKHFALMEQHNVVCCGSWECDSSVLRSIQGHAAHQAEMLVRENLLSSAK